MKSTGVNDAGWLAKELTVGLTVGLSTRCREKCGFILVKNCTEHSGFLHKNEETPVVQREVGLSTLWGKGKVPY